MSAAHPFGASRYSRQIRYAPIGEAGQERLSGAHAAVVGAGALGCVAANHLARAGVGKLTLIDRDIVEESNLQRQMLYEEADAAAGTPKAAAAAARLARINGTIAIAAHVAELNAFNAEKLLAGADVIVDGSDNFAVRYLINELSVKHGVPWIYGGAVGASGMTATFVPDGASPCFRCLFPAPPPGGSLDTCETAGVLAPIVDTIASIEAMEALKLLSGQAEARHGSLVQIDLWHHDWRSLSVRDARRDDCPVCGGRTFELLDALTEESAATVSLCGRRTIQVCPARPGQLDLQALGGRWKSLGRQDSTPYSLRLHLPGELTFVLFTDGRALVTGTDDPAEARKIYAGLLGQ